MYVRQAFQGNSLSVIDDARASFSVRLLSDAAQNHSGNGTARSARRMVGSGVVPRHRDFKNLDCQTALSAITGAKGILLRCKTNWSLRKQIVIEIAMVGGQEFVVWFACH
jgi:hypothetical protein